MSEAYPFQRLDDRLAGKPVDDVLLDGVPDHLELPLRDWLKAAFKVEPPYKNRPHMEELAQQVVVSLQWSAYTSRSKVEYINTLVGAPTDELLVVVDAVLQCDGDNPGVSQIGRDKRAKLRDLLYRGRSVYRISDNGRQLVRRVDPTAEDAYRAAVGAADPTTAQLLADAWRHAYKPDPEPTTAYREAVRAVEQVACPLVLPNDNDPTLGKVIAHLQDAGHKWETVLVAKGGDPGGPEPVREVMSRLWTGQVSRHGGAKNSRDQDPGEAEAAVHAAVLLVHWLSSGTLRGKS
ncbi:hypothetical protein SAMN06265360_117110 [Haloechinothrix alba]|uniref:Abortive infection C-terminus n=1 Tax=Haloechinothrix alba TaxID=664784 RepID=A0A238YXG7_9PSEU|nr:hypothetical protein [Haloechinothrix alba]SNR75662.1 hypothetical protein SAMN06265360_117110 [Haloechinothrix alba]